MLFPKPKTHRDRGYLNWLKTLPCASCVRPPPSDPSHHGRHGMSIKAPDNQAIPLCRACHEFWGGPAATLPMWKHLNLTREERDSRLRAMAARYYARYLRWKERRHG